MLSFKQLSEKKTKIKINPKKEELMDEGNYSKGGKVKKDDSYLETDFKKRQKNNEKARKDLMKGPQMKNPHFESTEDAYVSQEEVSEESTEEIAETETFLTFGQYQHALTLDEEQLNEFLKGLLGGGGSKPASSSSGQMPSHAGLASKLGQRRQMMNKLMGKKDTKVLGFSKGGTVKKEEVEQVDEIFGALKGVGKAVGKAMSAVTPNASALSSTLIGPRGGAIGQILSKGGKVEKKKVKKEETELQEKELSIDDQMRISREAAAKRKPYKDGDHRRARAKQLKNAVKQKDTRTDAQKMTDATGPRPGSRYRGD